MQTIKVVKNHIVFPTKNAERARELFPTAKIATYEDRYICAVPHDIPNTRAIKKLSKDLPIESPIRTDYKWPGKYKPYEHQIVTADFAVSHERCFILNGMGTGKSAATLWACDYLMRKGLIQSVLIASPLSTLDRVWADEIFRICPRRKFKVLHGSRNYRLSKLDEPADFYIVNHDGLGILIEALEKRPDINHIIIDELGSLRNQRTQRWKAHHEVINRQHRRSCWGLTGTPTPNEPTDAYAQVKLLTPERYRGSFRMFKEATMYQISQFKWVPKPGAEQIVASIMQPSIRFALEDCIDLPPTIHQTRMCDLSSEQEKVYKALVKDQIAAIGDTEITAVHAGALLQKLSMCAAGVLYGEEGERLKLDFGPRWSLLKEVIEECDEKVIVFVPFTGTLEAIEHELKKHWSVAVIDGSTPKGERSQTILDFQNNIDPHVLLANAGTMAHGLTLTAASMIVWYAPTNNNDIYNQANARIVRPGQTKVTNIVHLCATKEEEKIYKGLQEKTRLQDIVLQLVKGDKG